MTQLQTFFNSSMEPKTLAKITGVLLDYKLKDIICIDSKESSVMKKYEVVDILEDEINVEFNIVTRTIVVFPLPFVK